DEIRALTETTALPPPDAERATLRRFRNIVGDLGCDFDVATRLGRIHGFVHVAYARDLLAGNRASLLALVADSAEVRAKLFDSALVRARERHCRDLTIHAGPWTSAVDTVALGTGGTRIESGVRIELYPLPELG